MITNKRTLRQQLEFGSQITFDMRDCTLVYASDTKPCDYAAAALHGCRLGDDFVNVFGCVVRRKVQQNMKQTKGWPLTPEEMMT